MKHLIIGNCAAGIAAAEAIRQQDPGCSVTIITDEDTPYYSRCLLPDYLAGSLAIDKLLLKRLDFYRQHGLTLLAGEKAEHIDPAAGEVRLADGKRIPYDRLLIATGTGTFFPPLPGVDLEGVMGLRTIADAEKIMTGCHDVREAVVIGAGLVGLEVAEAFATRGIKVTVVEKMPQILPLQLDPTAAGLVSSRLEDQGIKLITGVGFTGIDRLTRSGKSTKTKTAGKGRLAVALESGDTLPADLVIVAAGTRPNTGLAKEIGIKVNRGILVNERMETSIPGIYAAGDVVETVDAVTGLLGLSPIWPNAVKQGKVAGLNMAGLNLPGEPLIAMQNSMNVGDLDVISLGLINPPLDGSYQVLARHKGSSYKKLVFKGRVLVGVILVNQVELAGVYGALIKTKKPVMLPLAALMDNSFNYSRLLTLLPVKVS